MKTEKKCSCQGCVQVGCACNCKCDVKDGACGASCECGPDCKCDVGCGCLKKKP
jgi:hypothetical protein